MRMEWHLFEWLGIAPCEEHAVLRLTMLFLCPCTSADGNCSGGYSSSCSSTYGSGYPAIMKYWTKVDPPDLALFPDLSHSVAQTDWYGMDDNHIPPNLIKTGFTNVNQQPVWGQEASVDARRDISRLCFQRLRETVTWQGGVEQEALKVDCTGLGGGEPPDNTYDAGKAG